MHKTRANETEIKGQLRDFNICILQVALHDVWQKQMGIYSEKYKYISKYYVTFQFDYKKSFVKNRSNAC